MYEETMTFKVRSGKYGLEIRQWGSGLTWDEAVAELVRLNTIINEHVDVLDNMYGYYDENKGR